MEKTLPLTVQLVKESRFNDTVIPLLTNKLVYPHGLVKKLDDFERITTFPDRDAFYDGLTESHISESDYQYAKRVWETAGCKNLRDLHDLYLLCDVSMLGDVWSDFNNRIFQDFGSYSSNYCTGPAMTFRAGMKMSETDIKL